MAHVRIRRYNTNDYYSDQKLGIDLCMAVRAGSHIFVRGQTGMAFDGSIVGVGDPAAQAEQAMKCVKILLEEAGSKLEHICKIHVYVIDRAYREPVYRVIGKWLKGVYPCSTGLIVSALARPELLMEIDVDAVIPEGERVRGKGVSTDNKDHLRKRRAPAKRASRRTAKRGDRA